MEKRQIQIGSKTIKQGVTKANPINSIEEDYDMLDDFAFAQPS